MSNEEKRGRRLAIERNDPAAEEEENAALDTEAADEIALGEIQDVESKDRQGNHKDSEGVATLCPEEDAEAANDNLNSKDEESKKSRDPEFRGNVQKCIMGAVELFCKTADGCKRMGDPDRCNPENERFRA